MSHLVDSIAHPRNIVHERKRKLKEKVRNLTRKVKEGKITSKEAKKYLCGHLGYLKIANTYNIENKLIQKIKDNK